MERIGDVVTGAYKLDSNVELRGSVDTNSSLYRSVKEKYPQVSEEELNNPNSEVWGNTVNELLKSYRQGLIIKYPMTSDDMVAYNKMREKYDDKNTSSYELAIWIGTELQRMDKGNYINNNRKKELEDQRKDKEVAKDLLGKMQ